MRVLDLFSGIGGFSLGFERAGMTTVAFCEIEPYCQQVLRQHWPHVPIYEDITALTGQRLSDDGISAIDLVCGGYPCQPFSEAGRQLGESDPRHLWPEMYRVIREVRPRWVVCENVDGHIKLGFDTVAAQLEAENFDVWPFVIPACSVGSPHRRNRLWIVANARGGRCGGAGSGEMEQPGRAETQRSGEAVADAGEQHGAWRPARPGWWCPIEGHAPQEYNGRGGATNVMWEPEPDVGRVAHWIPHRLDRLRALGNAVVPQIPEIIGIAILAYELRMSIGPQPV